MSTPETKFKTKFNKFINDLKKKGYPIKSDPYIPGILGTTGFPDKILCVRGYYVAVELKAANGHPSPEQLVQMELIKEAGGYAFLLFPDGFNQFKEFIMNILEG